MPATSGTRPQRISMIAIRVSGWTMRMSAAAMIWLPAPNATPCTAAITGTGISRQPHAAYWALLTMPFVRSARVPPALLAPGSRSLLRLDRSSPAQKARPSPDSTTTRSPALALSSSIASANASHIAPSSAFILSARIRRTSAMPPSSMVIEIRSFMGESSAFNGSGRPRRAATGRCRNTYPCRPRTWTEIRNRRARSPLRYWRAARP